MKSKDPLTILTSFSLNLGNLSLTRIFILSGQLPRVSGSMYLKHNKLFTQKKKEKKKSQFIAKIVEPKNSQRKSSPTKHEVHGSILGLLVLVRLVEWLEPIRRERYPNPTILRPLVLISVQIYYQRVTEKKVMSHNIWLGGRVSASAVEILPPGAPPRRKNTVGIAIGCKSPRLVDCDPMLDTVTKFLECEVGKVEEIAPVKSDFQGEQKIK